MKRLPANIEVISDDVAAVYRAMTPAQRLKTASGMYSSARRMLIAYLMQENPQWDKQRAVREAARRLSHGAC